MDDSSKITNDDKNVNRKKIIICIYNDLKFYCNGIYFDIYSVFELLLK